jgi:hypothetical protein
VTPYISVPDLTSFNLFAVESLNPILTKVRLWINFPLDRVHFIVVESQILYSSLSFAHPCDF